MGANFNALGGAKCSLGIPTSNELTISANGGDTGQVFEKGSVYSSSVGGVTVYGKNRDPYFALRWAEGDLGRRIREAICSPIACTPECQYCFVSSSSSGTRSVVGDIVTAYAQARGPAGSLGHPTSDLIDIPENVSGSGQAFQHGSVYSSNAGTFPVSGDVRSPYFQTGGAAGAPGSADSCFLVVSPRRRVCAIVHEGSPPRAAAPALVVTNEVAEAYRISSGPTGVLGASVTGSITIVENGGGIG